MDQDIERAVNPCGPHCGTKDKYTRHCAKCHERVSHGNVWVIPGSDFEVPKWVPLPKEKE